MSYDGEICQECGLPVALGIGSYWNAPDDLWRKIVGGDAGVLCPRCFYVACDKRGIAIRWEAARA